MRRPMARQWRAQLRAQLLDGGAGQQARVARQVLERQRQPEVGHHADQAFLQAVGHRVIDPVRRQAAVQVVGGHRRAHEQEIVVEVVAVQDAARHRVEEGLGALGLAVVRQQADEFLLHLLPERGLRIVQRGGPAVRAAGAVRGGFAVGRVRAVRARRAAGPAAQRAFELRGAFAHAHVVVLDALARQALDAVPVARFIQRLGAARCSGTTRSGGRSRPGCAGRRRAARAGNGRLLDALDVGHADHGGTRAGRWIRPFRRTTRGRSACGGFRWCRRRSRRAWRRATGGPPGIH